MKKLGSYFSLSQFLSFATLIVAGSVVTHLQWSKMVKQEEQTILTKEEYLREEKNIETNIQLLSKIPSLGFDNLVANAAFLSFIQYFGDDNARSATGYSVTPSFFEVAVERDPLFLDMYPMLSSTITLYGGYPAKSIELLDQGIQSIPESFKSKAYFLLQSKATDELLFMGQPKAAEKSYRQAAAWAQTSEAEENQRSARQSLQTANFLSKNPDSRSAQIASWFNILNSSIDERTQGLAVQQIQELGGVVNIQNGNLSITFPEE